MSNITQAVLLSAGFGTRLRDITKGEIPKVMVPIAGKPLLQYHIEALKAHGVSDFFINLHYLPDVITDYFGDGSKFGVKITYAFEPEIRGTAGGIKNFEKDLKDFFFVLYADTFYNISYKALTEFFFSRNDAIGCTSARTTDHPWDSDLAELAENGQVTAFHRKPHEKLPKEYWGTSAPYIFKSDILARIPAQTYYEIDHHLVPELLSRGEKYYAYRLQKGEFRKDIGTPERYREIQDYVRG